jgi:hypothetical protein
MSFALKFTCYCVLVIGIYAVVSWAMYLAVSSLSRWQS